MNATSQCELKYKYVILSIKISDNRLISIIANDCTPMLTKPYLKRSFNFPNIKQAISTAYEMQRGAREMVLDMVLRFWCRNGGGIFYKTTGIAFGNLARKRPIL